MAAARDWDALVEDIEFLRDTGEVPLGVMRRLAASGTYTGTKESLTLSLRRRGKGSIIATWLADAVEPNIVTQTESRRMSSNITQAFN